MRSSSGSGRVGPIRYLPSSPLCSITAQSPGGKVVNTAYLGGTVAHLIETSGIRLQAITLIDGRVPREGGAVEIAVAPADCTLLDAAGKRVGAAPG